MNKIILTRGLPASGKSFWAKQYVNQDTNTIIVTKDDLRLMFANTNSREKKVLKLRNEITRNALANNKTVIWADTNFNPIHKATAETIADEFKGSEVSVIDFPVDVEICIERDKSRGDKSVGSKVIWDMYWKNIASVYYETQDLSLPKAVICDLDGTIAKMSDRSPYDWDRVDEDTCDEMIKIMIKNFHLLGYKIFFLSGRQKKALEKTQSWLKDNDLALDNVSLILREEGDNRDDTVFKLEVYRKDIKPYYQVSLVLDDRPKMVRMWKRMGFNILNANGVTDYEF